MSGDAKVAGLLPMQQAIQIIHDTIIPITKSSMCLLEHALDKVVAQDTISPINVPSYDNSAMDGYALKFADLGANKHLKMVGKSFAGKPYGKPINSGECIRIMTGAEIPEGADTVVMQENTQADGESILFTHEVNQGDAIRQAGSDIKKGAVVLSKGARMSAINIGLLASLGMNQLLVLEPLRVAVFSTGDELMAAGDKPSQGKIYDSNRPMVVAMLKKLGAEIFDLGIIPDNKAMIRAAIEKADSMAHCVITSGGVSVGEADFTREVLAEYGEIDFWKLAIKPGKPLAFGRLVNSLFFGLPGNPVSAAVTFDKIVAPALAVLAGSSFYVPFHAKAKAMTRFRKRPGRSDYQRAHYSYDEQGELVVKVSGTQSSGVLSSYSKSNCYAVLERDRGFVDIGEQVIIHPFDSVII